ncbi:MAG: type II secretion system F family protein [Candidatus Woykebacteria bacterium]
MFNFTVKKEPKIIPLKVKLPFIERLTLVESLGIMLGAGIPILDAFESIENDSDNLKTKGVVRSVRDSIQKGHNLAESFSQFPNIFDDIFVNTVKAGEESGGLDKVLKQLSDNMKQEEELKNDIKQAAFYPAIVLGVLFFVMAVLFGFVVPRVAEIFEKLTIPKPLPTRILLSTALFVNKYYIFVGIFILIAAIGTIILLSNKEVRKKLLTASFHIPVFGSVLRYLDLSRLSSTLSLLLSAGIPIIKAVEASSTVVLNKRTKRELEEVTHKLTEGKGLAEGMREFKTFPTLMTRIISTGEKTGQLDEVLAGVALHYHDKLSREVKTLSTVIEPALIIVIGIIVGSVILAVISPIYQLISQISPG